MHQSKSILWLVSGLCLLLAMVGCVTPSPVADPTAAAVSSPRMSPAPLPASEGPWQKMVGFTYIRPDGNRLVSGQANLPQAVAVDLALDGVPVWLVAAPLDDGSLWVAVLDDGRVEAFEVRGGSVTPADLAPNRLPTGMPPVLLETTDGFAVLEPGPDASTATHPVWLAQTRTLAYVATNGDLVVAREGSGVQRLALNALPDARILVDERERLLLLTGATDQRYDHGVLGDTLEAALITLVETSPDLRVAAHLSLPEPKVVEGISPIWVDLDGDGTRETIVTVSDRFQGAQVLVYSESGEIVAAGPAIGQGFRWRHQLAVGPFGPQGEIEFADLLTPHIGGVVVFYSMVDQNLRDVSSVPGYSSHEYGSRNLDMALAGDFDADGQLELLVPNQQRNQLAAVQHKPGGAVEDWLLPLDGHLSSNLMAVELSDGQLALGAGRVDKVLRLWLPGE